VAFLSVAGKKQRSSVSAESVKHAKDYLLDSSVSKVTCSDSLLLSLPVVEHLQT
jgi:hypothetical protein